MLLLEDIPLHQIIVTLVDCVLFKEMCPTAFKIAKKILKDEPIWDEYFKSWTKMTKLLELQKLNKNDGIELYNLMKDIQSKARLKLYKT